MNTDKEFHYHLCQLGNLDYIDFKNHDDDDDEEEDACKICYYLHD